MHNMLWNSCLYFHPEPVYSSVVCSIISLFQSIISLFLSIKRQVTNNRFPITLLYMMVITDCSKYHHLIRIISHHFITRYGSRNARRMYVPTQGLAGKKHTYISSYVAEKSTNFSSYMVRNRYVYQFLHGGKKNIKKSYNTFHK